MFAGRFFKNYTMKKETHFFILFFVCLFFFTACKEKANIPSDVEEIVLDHNNLVETKDALGIIDSSDYRFVNLETSDNCLIGHIERVWLRGDKFIVYDDLVQQVLIFNQDGSFYAKVHAVGHGPGEYTQIDACFVGDSYVAIIENGTSKVKLYSFEGQFIKDISTGDCQGIAYFTFDNEIFYAVNDHDNPMGNCRLFSFGANKTNLKTFLHYKEPRSRGWGLRNYYTINNHRALFIVSTVDVIYEVSATGEAKPAYYVNIKNNKIPNNILLGDSRRALMYSIETGKITGLTNIHETSKHIILVTSNDAYLFYNKQSKKVDFFTERLQMSTWGNLGIFKQYGHLENDVYIGSYEAQQFRSYKNMVETKEYKDEKFKNSFEEAINKVESDMDNPILFVTKFLK